MTDPAGAGARAGVLEAARFGAGRFGAGPGGVGLLGAGLLAVATAVAAVLPPAQVGLAAAAALGLPLLLVAGLLLHRYPWLAPWGAVVLFSTTAELRLRLTPEVGVLKDVYLGLLVVVVALPALRRAEVRDRLRPLAPCLAAIGIVAALYLLDPAGGHGTSWLFGTRLLFSVLALMLVGLVCAGPERAAAHLVRATAAVLAFEAVFSWAQQLAGSDALVYGWGYRYGAQVRGTSGGGLRTSGSFEDPFQLAALAVLGLALGLFVASRWLQAVLVVSSLAVLGATSVRTAWVQVAVLLVVLAVRRGWWRQAATLGAVGAVAGIFLLATTTTSDRPGAPEVPLLFGLNGRSTAWAQAVEGPESFVTGNGVGAIGIGSTRTSTGVSAPPAYDPGSAPPASYAGDSAFLDSTYAQVQSDVGIVGTLALLVGLAGLAAVLARRCRRGAGAPWAAVGVLAVSLVDWVGRSSLASYTTGFLTMYMLGVLVAASLEKERTP